MRKTWRELKECYYKSTVNGITLYLLEGKKGKDLYHICSSSSECYTLRRAKDGWSFSESNYDTVKEWRLNRASF